MLNIDSDKLDILSRSDNSIGREISESNRGQVGASHGATGDAIREEDCFAMTQRASGRRDDNSIRRVIAKGDIERVARAKMSGDIDTYKFLTDNVVSDKREYKFKKEER